MEENMEKGIESKHLLSQQSACPSKASRKEISDEIKACIEFHEDLPPMALSMSTTHYDILSVLHLLLALSQAED